MKINDLRTARIVCPRDLRHNDFLVESVEYVGQTCDGAMEDWGKVQYQEVSHYTRASCMECPGDPETVAAVML